MLNIDIKITYELISYITDYINEEITRGASIDKYTVTDAILSFEGGAADGMSGGEHWRIATRPHSPTSEKFSVIGSFNGAYCGHFH